MKNRFFYVEQERRNMVIEYFDKLLAVITDSLQKLDEQQFMKLEMQMKETLVNGKKIIVSGLGKNVPICEKFVGTMQSLGMEASFLHTNSAVHGDLGNVHKGDMVILLSKSGETEESIYLSDFILKKNANLWLITFEENCTLGRKIKNKLVIQMSHEGDMWNLVPNNSTTLYLIILQALAILTAEDMKVLVEQFKENHPGGHIGELLKGV